MIRRKVSEEQVFHALFSRMDLVQWKRLDASRNPTGDFIKFRTKSRRVKMFSDSGPQPACYQAEYSDMSAQKSGMPYREIWEANWIIYHNVAKDQHTVPATENNLILDAVREALMPVLSDPGYYEDRNTLGGLVHHCFIEGRIFKDPGDIDNQGMLVVPIKLLVP